MEVQENQRRRQGGNMKNKKFGNFEVSKYGMYYNVGDCSLEEEDIENLRKALKEYDKRKKCRKQNKGGTPQ